MSGFRQSSGSLEVTQGGLSIPLYDAVDNSGATANTDLFVFYLHGLGGTEVCRVLITYTDSSKSQILTVQRTIP
jgi:hypothetical protein